MRKRPLTASICLTAVTLSLILTSAIAMAQAARYSVITNLGLNKGEGKYPLSSVVFDHSGNLFGFASGGVHEGTAFELTPKTDGYWTEKTIYQFLTPAYGSPVIDADGNLYGAEAGGGTYHFGSVFELSPSDDGSWTKTDIYSFPGAPGGAYPRTGVVFDNKGNLYGTTSSSGLYNEGTVFELSPQKDGRWTETELYNFPVETDLPADGLTVDQVGNLYGTGSQGGAGCSAVAFSLTKPKLETGSWSYTVLHTFPGGPVGDQLIGDAASPNNVIVDAEGNLYGTSSYGGKHGYGTVFEIPAGGPANGPDKILYSFYRGNRGGWNPKAGLVFDSSGNLYGTTSSGGSYEGSPQSGLLGGKVFKLSPQDDGSWIARALYNFGGRTYHGVLGADGFFPAAALTIGPDGDLYGTTEFGGYYPGEPAGNDAGHGTVFKLVVH